MGGGTSKRKPTRSPSKLVAPMVQVDILSPMRTPRMPTEECQSLPFDDLDEESMRSVFVTDDPILSEEPNLLVQAQILQSRCGFQHIDFAFEKSRQRLPSNCSK